jgi:hypothetical protein
MIVSIIFSIWASVFSHPLHVTFSELNYNKDSKTIELSIRIFTDDFETTLRSYSSAKVDLTHPSDKKTTEKWMNDYIQKNFVLYIDSKLQTLQFVGYEIKGESVWVYFESVVSAVPKKFNVINQLLYDFSNKQMNLIRVIIENNEKTGKLTHPDKSLSFSF